MATLKQRLHRKNGSTYDVVHLETESNVVMRPSGNTVETDLTNYLPKVQNSDDVPEGLTSGQISIGPTKGYYCTGDGEVKEFGKGSGGGVPVLDQDFTYTGECHIIDDTDDTEENWRIKFLTSGTLIPLKDIVIDIFLVGGGGSGAVYSGSNNSSVSGGGGGYTKTKTNVYLHTNSEYNITIASGGSTPSRTAINGSDGGTTSISSETVTFENLSVVGGKGGKASSNSSATGGDGGSGGGSTTNQTSGISVRGGLGGINGSGGQIIYSDSGNQASMTWYSTGQGTTTREFGEETYDLYATGGNGCWNTTKQEGGGGYSYTNKYAGTPNTGGGGAAGTSTESVIPSINTAGGSGIVVIRNHREK